MQLYVQYYKQAYSEAINKLITWQMNNWQLILNLIYYFSKKSDHKPVSIVSQLLIFAAFFVSYLSQTAHLWVWDSIIKTVYYYCNMSIACIAFKLSDDSSFNLCKSDNLHKISVPYDIWTTYIQKSLCPPACLLHLYRINDISFFRFIHLHAR